MTPRFRLSRRPQGDGYSHPHRYWSRRHHRDQRGGRVSSRGSHSQHLFGQGDGAWFRGSGQQPCGDSYNRGRRRRVVQEKQIVDLPLNSRRYADLSLLDHPEEPDPSKQHRARSLQFQRKPRMSETAQRSAPGDSTRVKANQVKAIENLWCVREDPSATLIGMQKPEPPGPPGLKKIESIRRWESLAGNRMSGSLGPVVSLKHSR